jgi:hypothetical protein
MERISNKISRNPGYQHCASSSHCKLYDPKCAIGRKYFNPNGWTHCPGKGFKCGTSTLSSGQISMQPEEKLLVQ